MESKVVEASARATAAEEACQEAAAREQAKLVSLHVLHAGSHSSPGS